MTALGRLALTLALAAPVLTGSLAARAAERTRLTIYTALENDQLGPFKAGIERAVPEVEVVWVRDSTGVVTARFLAEKDNPRADMVMGLAASSLLTFEKQGLLAPYEPKGVEALKPAFRDTKAPYTWTGTDASIGVICFNTAEAEKDKAKTPARWADLLAPELKGKVVMPHPASSGTGYLLVAGWLQGMGEEAGWAYMDRLHDNIAAYLHSGSAPCVQAARGERTAGLSLDMRGAAEKTKGAPLAVIAPADGTGWDEEAYAIVATTKHMEAARKVADWGATKAANELYAKSYAVVAYPGVATVPANYPAGAEAAMIKNDLGWMADNRERVLAEWSRRYEAKAAKK